MPQVFDNIDRLLLLERTESLTRQALEIVSKHGLNNQVLTKGSPDLIHEDMNLIKAARTQLGITGKIKKNCNQQRL